MTESCTINSSLSFSFELVDMTSPDRNYQEVINLLLSVSPGLYLNILKTEKNVAVSDRKFSTSFQRKKVKTKQASSY